MGREQTLAVIPADVTSLHHCLLDTEGRIDQALDRGDRRAFRAWCKRHASVSARLQRTLLALALPMGS